MKLAASMPLRPPSQLDPAPQSAPVLWLLPPPARALLLVLPVLQVALAAAGMAPGLHCAAANSEVDAELV